MTGTTDPSVPVRRIPRDSGLWPLPADYFELANAEAQRRARVNACRQYLLDWGSPDENANVFAACVSYFDREYLWPDPDNDFYPNFYDQPPLPEAPFHYFMQRAYWKSTFMVMVAPRGGTKTMQILKRTLLRAVAERGFSCVYATSTHSLARTRGALLRTQFRMNPRITSDWEPEYGGRLAPTSRGELTFNAEHMSLYNGSVVVCCSAFSRQRGRRPITYEFDDPEYDPSSKNTDLQARRDELADVLFSVICPMMTRPGSRLPWTGTFISPQHLLWSAVDADTTKDGRRVPADPRFAEWSRYVIKAAQEDDRGNLVRSNWPHMWPLDHDELRALDLPESTFTLARIRRMLGEPVFQAEMQANPGVIHGSYFPVNRASDETHDLFGYTIEDEDEHTYTDPTRTRAVVRWNRWEGNHPVPMSFPLSDLVNQCRTFITVDTAYSTSKSADWKVAHVLLWTPQKEMFSLDLYDTHEEEFVFAQSVLRLADRWRSVVVYPEVTNTQQSLYKTLLQYAQDNVLVDQGVTHVPGVRPLHTGRESKTSRIASLRVWFDLRKIHLPFFRAHTPAYTRLFDQLEGFSPEVKEGGLRHDDHLDTLEMAQRTAKISTDRLQEAASDPGATDPLDRIRSGELINPRTGIPWAAYMDPSKIPTSELIEAAYTHRETKARRGRRESVA